MPLVGEQLPLLVLALSMGVFPPISYTNVELQVLPIVEGRVWLMVWTVIHVLVLRAKRS